MRGNPLLLAPPALGVLAVLIFLGMLLSREVFHDGSLPVFLPQEQGIVHIELTGGGLVPGMYQFYDGLTPAGVIKLTMPQMSLILGPDTGWFQPLADGEILRFSKKDQKIALLQREWMPASHRIAMGIPLHPDRMTQTDWLVLPGIGADLAARIESDRQKNGEFGSLKALARVNGIGGKRLDHWKIFF